MRSAEEQEGQDWDRLDVRESAGGDLESQQLETGAPGDWWDGDEQVPPSSGRRGVAVLALLAVGAAVVLGWWWFGREADGVEFGVADREPVSAPASIAVPTPEPEVSVDPTADLPALGESDEWVRSLAGGLSAHPRLAEFLLGEQLIREGVRLVAAVAYGDELGLPPAFRPRGLFEANGSSEAGVASVAGGRRYEVLVSFLEGIDVDGAGELYARCRPLVEMAHRELGLPGTFAETSRRAVRQLDGVPAQVSPLLERRHTSWHFVDPDLESMTPAQKALLRLDPQQRQRVLRVVRRLLAVAAGG